MRDGEETGGKETGERNRGSQIQKNVQELTEVGTEC